MRITDPDSGKSFFSKRRRRFDGMRTARSLTFSCYKRFPLLAKERSRTWFVEALQKARTKYVVDVWAWVIMPEHVHLLVCPREEGQLVGKFQGLVKELVARRAIRWLEQHQPAWIEKLTALEGVTSRRRFWQPGGGYDRNLETDKVIIATIDY